MGEAQLTVARRESDTNMNDNLSADDRIQMAKQLLQLLDHWGLEARDRIILLGLPENTKPRALIRYRNGQALPDNGELLERAENLLSIQHSLEILFPRSAVMARYWISTENAFFGNRPPLDVMLSGGLAGISGVRQHLEGNSDDY